MGVGWGLGPRAAHSPYPGHPASPSCVPSANHTHTLTLGGPTAIEFEKCDRNSWGAPVKTLTQFDMRNTTGRTILDDIPPHLRCRTRAQRALDENVFNSQLRPSRGGNTATQIAHQRPHARAEAAAHAHATRRDKKHVPCTCTERARSSNHFCARAVCATPESSLFERARAQDVHLDGVREPGATVDISQRAYRHIGRGEDLWAGVRGLGEDHLLASSSPGSHGRWPPSPKSIADTTSGSDANARWPARARQKVRPARTASGSGQAHHGTRKGRGRRGGEGRSKVSAAAARWARRWQKWAHFRSSSAGQAPDFPPSPHR